MKITVCGKGGCGKSTVSALLAKEFERMGKTVLVADSDESNYGLHRQLGVKLPRDFTEYFGGKEKAFKTMMVGEILDTVKLSAFAKKFYSEPFTLNEIPEEYISRNNGVMLISSGKIHQANEGCACTMNSILKQFIKHLTVGENVMLKRIINNLILHREDVVLLDMEAGLEHLGRGTTEGMDQFIVVIEPGARSVQTYRNVKRLAEELGVKKVRVVANKIRDVSDEAFVKDRIPESDLLGFVHYNPEIMNADREGVSPYDFSQTAVDEIKKIKEKLG